MKRIVMVALVLVVSVVAAVALTVGEVIDKGAYENKGISADMTQNISVPAQNLKMRFTGKIYMKGDNSRVEMIITQDSFNNPAQYQQVKMMKMDEMIIISNEKDGKSVNILAYPKLNGYVESTEDEMAGAGAEMDSIAKMAKELVEKVGAETFAGVQAMKYRIIPDPEDEDAEESFFYVNPSNKLIVGFSFSSEEGSVGTVEFTQLKTGVEDSLFNAPANMKKFDNVQQLAMSGMM
jgi:hypothetical protein